MYVQTLDEDQVFIKRSVIDNVHTIDRTRKHMCIILTLRDR